MVLTRRRNSTQFCIFLLLWETSKTERYKTGYRFLRIYLTHFQPFCEIVSICRIRFGHDLSPDLSRTSRLSAPCTQKRSPSALQITSSSNVQNYFPSYKNLKIYFGPLRSTETMVNSTPHRLPRPLVYLAIAQFINNLPPPNCYTTRSTVPTLLSRTETVTRSFVLSFFF